MCRVAIIANRVNPPEQRIGNFSRGGEDLPSLPELDQVVSLSFEQAGFYGCGAAQPPSRLANRNTSSRSHRLGRESMTDGVTAGTLFTFFGAGTGAFARIAPVGFDLPERRH
jgi:hypothetical protein